MTTLHLTLKKEWFDLMVSGEKRTEYRSPSNWIKSRLEKQYDTVKFVNGYGKDKPYFICEYKGFEISQEEKIVRFNTSKIDINKDDYIIHLGKILEIGNL